MSGIDRRVSSGLKGIDEATDWLRLGDNVVWQVDTMDNYRYVVEPYVIQARKDGRKLVYIRFGLHEPVLEDCSGIRVYEVSPQSGFEDFATRIHNIITEEGQKAFYVFDCLTDLLKFWYSDLMIGNFFMVTCPYLFLLDTVAYFAVRRNVHTYDTIARIRETTQLLLDLYEIDDDYYVHPLKVWQRYSPTMFLPHKITSQGCVSITSSAETAELLSNLSFGGERMDYWNMTMDRARETLATGDPQEREEAKKLLATLLVGRHTKMYDMCIQYVDMEVGMLRLVMGLGTRAVDRVIGDYVKIVTLDNPLRSPLMNREDEVRYSQHKLDVLNLKENRMDCIDVEEALKLDIKTDRRLFGRKDPETARRLREMGRDDGAAPFVVNFRKMLADTRFPEVMRRTMQVLSEKYHYPVDIEYTANFQADGSFKFNLLQCRPLQTQGLGKTVDLPEVIDRNRCLFCSGGNFMGGNVRLPIGYVVLVKTLPYLQLPDREKYTVARRIGMLNELLKGKNAMLIGPGRWGTTTPSLGVPVRFTELCNMSAMCELSYSARGVAPELSYGSHFFQDVVESGIFYAAIFGEREGVTYHEEYLIERENKGRGFLPEEPEAEKVIGVYETQGLQLYSDITKQLVYCAPEENTIDI